jgi:hypothetical protein
VGSLLGLPSGVGVELEFISKNIVLWVYKPDVMLDLLQAWDHPYKLHPAAFRVSSV